MKGKKYTLITLKHAFKEKYPDSKIEFLEMLPKNKVKLEDEYGKCICSVSNIMWYGKTTIKTAIDKTTYFINRSKKIHGEKYIYDFAEYTDCFKKVKLICKKHGEFFITPTSHWQNVGCCKCGDESHGNKTRKTSEQYNKEIAIIHNNNYHIKPDSYIDIKTKIPHFCETQKEWVSLRPGHVLEGLGCRKCANLKISKRAKENSVGWSYTKWEEKGKNSKYFDSFKVYILKCYSIKNKETFYKIGKTFQTIDRRFQSKREIPYKWKLIKVFIGESREMSELETKLKNINKNNKYLPKIKFAGMYECFNKIEEYEILSLT